MIPEPIIREGCLKTSLIKVEFQLWDAKFSNMILLRGLADVRAEKEMSENKGQSRICREKRERKRDQGFIIMLEASLKC